MYHSCHYTVTSKFEKRTVFLRLRWINYSLIFALCHSQAEVLSRQRMLWFRRPLANAHTSSARARMWWKFDKIFPYWEVWIELICVGTELCNTVSVLNIGLIFVKITDQRLYVTLMVLVTKGCFLIPYGTEFKVLKKPVCIQILINFSYYIAYKINAVYWEANSAVVFKNITMGIWHTAQLPIWKN
jgi:hypothetical protein